MTRKQHRLGLLALGMSALAGATALVLSAFSSNLVFFYSPSDLKTEAIAADRRVRIGGLVERRQRHRVRPADVPSGSASPTARPMSRSSIAAYCRICSARGRESSPKAS